MRSLDLRVAALEAGHAKRLSDIILSSHPNTFGSLRILTPESAQPRSGAHSGAATGLQTRRARVHNRARRFHDARITQQARGPARMSDGRRRGRRRAAWQSLRECQRRAGSA